ncbi:MAG TPA: tetratricopeptide repeat protein [Pyrinomonadaceae bacterium]|nr:tetratricopeptide repeat protein [Pyrinomonadaceae bacterium]
MSKNVLLCVIGVILGFVIGFFIANSITRPAAQLAAARTPSSAFPVSATAGPLKPEQMSGELPPGHPTLDGDAGGEPSSTAASTSAEAQAAMDKADRSPKDFQAQLDAGNTFYRHQDYDKAAHYLTRALAIKGKDFDALVLMGNTKYDDKDFAGAATFYERALAVKPNSPDVRADLGNTHFNRKDFDRAIAEYRKAVALAPDHLNSWKNIAAAAFQKRDKATATEAVEKISALSPGSEEIEALRQQLAQMP